MSEVPEGVRARLHRTEIYWTLRRVRLGTRYVGWPGVKKTGTKWVWNSRMFKTVEEAEEWTLAKVAELEMKVMGTRYWRKDVEL